jgi:hypothetical protein
MIDRLWQDVRRALLLVMLCAVGLSAQAPVSFQLVQVDRAGAMKPLGRMPPATFAPRVSPDGRQVAFDADAAVWIASLDNLSAPRRLASGFYPMWSGDGARVLFIVGIGEKQQMCWTPADGSGQPELLIPDARAPESWSTAAQYMTYITLKGGTDYVIPITLGPSPTVGTATPLPIKGFLQGGARRMYDITPDGTHFLMLFR